MSRIGKRIITVPENVNIDIQEKLVTVKGPKGELTLPLVDNISRKLDGNTLTVEKTKDDKFILKISDNGTGMSEEVKSRIFEPYYTTKANGTGLGMAMSYKIIKEFSGDISVDSVLGEGSEFTITIPIPQTQKKLLTHDEEAR